MLADGTYTGVVDRIEEGAEGTELAAILLEEDDEVVEQIDVSREALPNAAGVDTILSVTVADGIVVDLTHLQEETNTRKEAAQNRFDRLANRPPRDDHSDANGPSEE